MALTARGARFLVALFLVCTPNLAMASNRTYRRNLAATELLKLHANADGGTNTGSGVLIAVLMGVGIVAAILLTVAVFPPALVCAIQCLGFTASGIAAASWAAWIMSLSAGYVVAGSVCAVCQSIGALGFVSLTSLGALIMAICGAAVTVLPYLAVGVVVLGVLGALVFVGVKYVAPAVASFFKWLGSAIKSLFSSVGSFFSGIASSIKNFFSSIGSFFSGLIPFLTLTSNSPVKSFLIKLLQPFLQ